MIKMMATVFTEFEQKSSSQTLEKIETTKRKRGKINVDRS